MDEADNPDANYNRKTQPMIQKLVEKGEEDKLRAISQHMLQNAWYDVRFHLANDAGIHGACPSEMLHALLLGLLRYKKETFFKLLGENSEAAKQIDKMAEELGVKLSRQSDRDFPPTNFGKISKTKKLMGKKYRGVGMYSPFHKGQRHSEEKEKVWWQKWGQGLVNGF